MQKGEERIQNRRTENALLMSCCGSQPGGAKIFRAAA